MPAPSKRKVYEIEIYVDERYVSANVRSVGENGRRYRIIEKSSRDTSQIVESIKLALQGEIDRWMQTTQS